VRQCSGKGKEREQEDEIDEEIERIERSDGDFKPLRA
jgi:hypothetical protein